MDNEYRGVQHAALGPSCVISNRTKPHESQAAQQNNAAALTVFMTLTSAGFITLQFMTLGQNRWTQGGHEAGFNTFCTNT